MHCWALNKVELIEIPVPFFPWISGSQEITQPADEGGVIVIGSAIGGGPAKAEDPVGAGRLFSGKGL